MTMKLFVQETTFAEQLKTPVKHCYISAVVQAEIDDDNFIVTAIITTSLITIIIDVERMTVVFGTATS